MAYTVTAPLVIAKKQDGSDLYLYEGAVLPDFVPEADVKRLSDLGFVDKVPEGSSAKPRKPAAESN